MFSLGEDVDPGETWRLGQHLEACLSRIVLAMGFNEFGAYDYLVLSQSWDAIGGWGLWRMVVRPLFLCLHFVKE